MTHTSLPLERCDWMRQLVDKLLYRVTDEPRLISSHFIFNLRFIYERADFLHSIRLSVISSYHLFLRPNLNFRSSLSLSESCTDEMVLCLFDVPNVESGAPLLGLAFCDCVLSASLVLRGLSISIAPTISAASCWSRVVCGEVCSSL